MGRLSAQPVLNASFRFEPGFLSFSLSGRNRSSCIAETGERGLASLPCWKHWQPLHNDDTENNIQADTTKLKDRKHLKARS